MSKKTEYKIRAKVWLYPGTHSTSSGHSGQWHFVSVPRAKAHEIKARFGAMAAGFGSLPVHVTIGKTRWKTSIFPDSKTGTYVLPLKAEVRKKENIKKDQEINLSIEIII